MNCSRIQALLSAYADRELTGVEMFLVRQHVHECDACRREEEEMRHVKAILAAVGTVEPSPEFEARLVDAVMGSKAEPFEERRLRSATRVALTTLAAAATICVVYIVRGVPSAPHRSAVIAIQSPRAQTAGPNMTVQMRRDSAFMNSADPLAGPQGAVAASYAAP